jgi:hypothetical protein
MLRSPKNATWGSQLPCHSQKLSRISQLEKIRHFRHWSLIAELGIARQILPAGEWSLFVSDMAKWASTRDAVLACFDP